MLSSNVIEFSDLALTISVLLGTVPVITELSTNQNKHVRHSAAFKNQQNCNHNHNYVITSDIII